MMNRLWPLLFLPVLLAAQPATIILHGGRIVTVDARFSVAQAMAIRGDRIVATGTDAQILKLRGPQTEVIALNGKTVMPGLLDSHTHALDAALYEFDHPIGEMETIADVLKYLRGRAAVVPAGEWIRLQQVFITRLREQRYPTKAELDEVAPQHPVIFSTGPDAVLNTRALRLQGITKDTKATIGKVELDPATGEPNGILRSYEQFLKVPIGSGRRPTLDDRIGALQKLLADYNSVGITGIADRAASAEEVEVYREMRKRNLLTTRVFLSYHLAKPLQPMADSEAEIKRLTNDPLHKYDNLLWLRGVKIFLDGGMLTGSALMREPWGKSAIYGISDDNYRGMRYVDPERLFELARLVLKSGLQFTAHSVGDGAVQALIDAYARVNKEFPVRAARPCLTHANFMTADGIETMAKLGIVADMQPAWLERDGATLRRHFGDARLRLFQPYATLFKAGVTVGGGSDHMQKVGRRRSINMYDPWLGMWVAQVRQPRWTEEPLHPQEKLTREQVIRLYTINNAYLMFEEKQKGSLEAGKLADFIITAKDVLKCSPEELRDMTVERTYLGGRRVF